LEWMMMDSCAVSSLTGELQSHSITQQPKRGLSYIGAAFKHGQKKDGVDIGPQALRQAGLIDSLRSLCSDVRDLGDIASEDVLGDSTGVDILHMPRTVGEFNRQLAERVATEARENRFVLTIGGDHSIAIGTIIGLLRERPDLVIVWVDAHADINVPESSASGNIHGMPVSFLTALVDRSSVPGFEWMDQTLLFDRIAYVGLRDLDPKERDFIREKNIRAYTMHEVDQLGIVRVMDEIITHLNPQGDRPFHLSFDIDGVDSALCPATGTTAPGGLTLREARYLCERLAATGKLNSMDMVEVNPILSTADGSKKTVEAASYLIQSALGRTLL